MGKVKTKGNASVPHKHVYSRVSYLYQAATLLSATTSTERVAGTDHTELSTDTRPDLVAFSNDQAPSKQPRFLINHLRSISLKSQTRLHPEVKRSLCKHCDALLIPGNTSTVTVENASKDGRKPWADVLVITCNACRVTKRFPVGQPQSARGTEQAA